MKYYKSPSLQGGWLVSCRHPYSCAHSLDSWSAQTRKWNIYVIFRKQGHTCWPPGIIVTTGILLVQACRGPLTANGSAASQLHTGQEIFAESQLCSCNCLGHNNGAMGKGKDPLWVSLGEISPSILFSLLKYYYIIGLSLSSRNLINKFLYNFFLLILKTWQNTQSQVIIGIEHWPLKRSLCSVLRGLLTVKAVCSAIENAGLTQSSAGTQVVRKAFGSCLAEELEFTLPKSNWGTVCHVPLQRTQQSVCFKLFDNLMLASFLVDISVLL